MNFAGPMLMAVQSMAVAAPLLNEVRAKDHEIAYLRAKLSVLGADTSDFACRALPEIDLKARGRSLDAVFPNGWLAEHPLTAVDLEQEIAYLQAVGFRLSVS